MRLIHFLFLIGPLLTLGLVGCDSNATGDSADEQGDDTAGKAGFPSKMIVASPTSSGTSGSAKTLRSILARTSGYESLTHQLEDLLSGSSTVSDVFDPEAFYALSGDAECYGPELMYEDHPDGATPNSGSLPTGDLGIWVETLGTGEACAAAQLNEQLEGVQNRTFMSLMGLASLIIAYESGGSTWPDDVETTGSTGDLTSTLNAAGIANVTFVSAEIQYDSFTEQYDYDLEFTYSRGGTDYDIAVTLVYDKVDGDADDDTYESLLNLLVEDTFNNPGDQCTNDRVTRGTSLHFISNSATDIRMQSREAAWCEHFDFDTASLSNGLTLSLSDAGLSTEITGNVLNPDTDPDGSPSTLDGWENNFSYFTADFNPDTLRGDYAYIWQAGPGDSHSRVLNVGLEVTDGTVGESYFGYGDRVDSNSFEPIVRGFICNWAGPGNDHTLRDYAQRQHITLSETSGLYEPSNDNGSASNITYAPTADCTYTGGGTFTYDRDLDSDLSDETTDTINVGPSEILTLDLMDDYEDATSTDHNGIDNYIQDARGYDLPDYPN